MGKTHDKNSLAKCQEVVCGTPCDDQALFQVATPCPPLPWLMRAEQMLWVCSRGSKAGNCVLIATPRGDSLHFFTFASGTSGCVGECVHGQQHAWVCCLVLHIWVCACEYVCVEKKEKQGVFQLGLSKFWSLGIKIWIKGENINIYV